MVISEDSDGVTMAVEQLLCSEEEFAQQMRELVAEEEPRVFALVEEDGERVDGWIVGWGMAFDDRVEVLSVDGTLRMTFDSVDRVLRRYSRHRKIHLVWAQPPVPGDASEGR